MVYKNLRVCVNDSKFSVDANGSLFCLSWVSKHDGIRVLHKTSFLRNGHVESSISPKYKKLASRRVTIKNDVDEMKVADLLKKFYDVFYWKSQIGTSWFMWRAFLYLLNGVCQIKKVSRKMACVFRRLSWFRFDCDCVFNQSCMQQAVSFILGTNEKEIGWIQRKLGIIEVLNLEKMTSYHEVCWSNRMNRMNRINRIGTVVVSSCWVLSYSSSV